ncbi:UDP-glucosyltransferase 2-like [Onthophagus taurus]|uniref:UDP-glucosyltransferase 2-like n=1 Tax=Onthophagus taurus TaxID=166361 RepID=UPI0039BE7B57
MKGITSSVIFLLIFLNSFSNGSKILCIFPGVAHSHYTLGYAISKELAKKGHEVTYVSPFPEKNKVENLKSVVLTGFLELATEMMKSVNLFDMAGISPLIGIVSLGNMGLMLSEETLKNEALQTILKSNEKFDLVISESFFLDSFHAIANHYNAPSVLISTIGSSIWTNHLVGIPDIPSFMPNIYLGIENPQQTFCQRIQTLLLNIVQKLFDHIYFYPKQNQLIKKFFPNSPDVFDLIYNTSLILTNSHISFTKPQLNSPNMIEIGGYHVDEPKKLPQDLEKILNDAKNGVIYFSMGSNLKGNKLYPEIREKLLKVFGKLKQTVLWKFEDDNLPGKPENVIIRKWFPQNDILAHRNIKLFITHGGLLSTIESIYHGIPMVAIPVFGDQMMNAAYAASEGYAINIPFQKLNEESFFNGINQVLNNEKYRKNVQIKSKIFHDQQVKPIDKATYWIEYVIRHTGAKHLRLPSVNLPNYQFYMVDILAVMTVLIGVSFVLFCVSARWIIRRCNRRPTLVGNKIKKN